MEGFLTAARRWRERLNAQHLSSCASYPGLMMPFTDEEKRIWHEEKRKREHLLTPVFRSKPVASCAHCQNPFGINEGVITPYVALCDICNGS